MIRWLHAIPETEELLRFTVSGVIDGIDAAIDLSRQMNNLLQSIPGLRGRLNAVTCALANTFNAAERSFGFRADSLHNLGHLLGCLGGALGQATHFTGDDGESTSLLTGMRSFDGGIERQQIGAFGDVSNGIDDGVNLRCLRVKCLHPLLADLCIGGDGFHFAHHGGNLLAAFVGCLSRRASQFCCLAGVPGDAFDT